MSRLQRHAWFLTTMLLTAAVAVPAGAGQAVEGTGLLFIGDAPNSGDPWERSLVDTSVVVLNDKNYTQEGSVGVSYCVVNWTVDPGVDPNDPNDDIFPWSTASWENRVGPRDLNGNPQSLPSSDPETRWDEPLDEYEKLGTGGYGGWYEDITRAGRGLVRWDGDTFLVLSGAGAPAGMPGLYQIEFRDTWFDVNPGDPGTPSLHPTIGFTDDQYTGMMVDSPFLSYRMANRPNADGEDYPEPLPAFLPAPGPCDWSWTGGALTGKLQIADSATPTANTYWFTTQNPANPAFGYNYLTYNGSAGNFVPFDEYVGYGRGPFPDQPVIYTQSEYPPNPDNTEITVVDLVAFYGETENSIYTATYDGRIYRLTGAKQLGWRRAAGQPTAGTRLGNGGTTFVESTFNFFPLYTGGGTYATADAGGGPCLGDYIQTDPGPPPTWEAVAISSVELFNAALPFDPDDPNTLLPNVTGRHYTGLAVDAGGRVYAVSERIVNGSGDEPGLKFRGIGADVWNGAPGEYGPNRIEKASNLFGDPNTTSVAVGDTLMLTDGSVDQSFLNVEFTIEAIDPGGVYARLDGDCGDSEAYFNVSYMVYPPGASPIPDPNTNPFFSKAYIDVYQPDGTLDTTIDLNALTRPDGVSLGSYQYEGGIIQGVIIVGDVEIDPGLAYNPNDPAWPLDPLPANVTRLWIACAEGENDGDATDDGLDLAIMDVIIDPNGFVADASFVGGTDDPDLRIGQFQTDGDLWMTQGYDPLVQWESFNDIEFDGQGNLIWMGGRRNNDNCYDGMPLRSVREFLGRLKDAADPNDPNYGTGIVSVDAYDLGMDPDAYGNRMAYGFAFADSPLWNNGAGPIELINLVDTEPNANGSLPKTMDNLILCAFDGLVAALPAAGYPLLIRDIANGCADVSHFFAYTIDTDDPTGKTLQAKELPDPNSPLVDGLLTDKTWYQVNNAPGWAGVADFQFEVYTLVGDCNSSGRVTTLDYTCVKGALGARGDTREDLNGSARVTTADYTVAKDNMGHRAPVKPALCP